ncbi:MAG TPA: hypothetical protein VMU54_14875 [Planctomycetota bacterium]|nr:hypothetical protein [Planctomycetota bacterium]
MRQAIREAIGLPGPLLGHLRPLPTGATLERTFGLLERFLKVGQPESMMGGWISLES